MKETRKSKKKPSKWYAENIKLTEDEIEVLKLDADELFENGNIEEAESYYEEALDLYNQAIKIYNRINHL